MIASGAVDAVTITTPPETRRELVLQAIAAGLHVIADKPFAPDASSARDLDLAARAAGVTLGVYQNRRWDSDLQTLIGDGRLGKVWRVHSRMDFDDPATLEAGPTGGLLRDLGSHLVDQMLFLFGPVTTVSGHLDNITLLQGTTDASFHISIAHACGVHSHVSASKLNHFTQRELRAYGDAGAYVSHGTDVQAQAIFAGHSPAQNLAGWGMNRKAIGARCSLPKVPRVSRQSPDAIMPIMRLSQMSSAPALPHLSRLKTAPARWRCWMQRGNQQSKGGQ